MLAYAPTRHQASARPGTLALVVGVHVAVIAVALAAKFDAERGAPPIITDIYQVKEPPIPQPPPEPDTRTPTRTVSQIDTTRPLVAIPSNNPPVDQRLDDPPPSGPVAGEFVEPYVPPVADPPPVRRTKAMLRISAADIRPPYPESKRASEEEASLRLKLSIDAKGRVVAVEPVGRVDPTFFEAARRHILKSWRYTPATENGEPVATSMTVSLKFQLDG